MGNAEPDPRAFHDHFSYRAEGYALYRPHYPPELVDFLFERTDRSRSGTAIPSKEESETPVASRLGGSLVLSQPSPPSGTVWEAGCGSGQLTSELARRFAFVYATDASPKQIAQTTATPRVEYRVARADDSGLPDHSVDLAVAAQAAHWFDLDAYYAEVRRVVRPGGHISLTVYGIHATQDAKTDAIVQRFYHETLRGFWPAQRRFVEDEYRTMPFPFDELPAPRFAMMADWTLAEMLGYVETWSAVGELNKAKGRSAIDSFRAEMADAWGDPASRRKIRWPLTMRLGRV